jgi:putative N6-adenine-specific DNA methylase
MSSDGEFEIFLMSPPGLEPELVAEAREAGFQNPKPLQGGVRVTGGWREVWRANLELRGCGRVLARIGSFRAMHLAQLDKRARKFPWGHFLRKDVPVHVEASCTRSRIYHSEAAAQRIGRAIHEELGAPLSKDAGLVVKVRIEDDLCTISIDTSGESLHKRGHKEAVGRAPMRETLASLFLRRCGFDGREPVVDPMCGSGTFVIEAAEIAAGLKPGRSRSFAFEQLAGFDPVHWQAMRTSGEARTPGVILFGSDRDAGAVRMARENAARAGVGTYTNFRQQSVSELVPPEGPVGLVIANPPYGTRIGDKKPLHALYGALGQTLLQRFSGWRVGIITTEGPLAKSTGLPFQPPSPPVLHGGLKVTLFQTAPLP